MNSASATVEDIANAVSRSIEDHIDLEEIYETASDLLMRIPHVDMLMIYVVEEESGEAVLESQRNVSREYMARASRIPRPKGMTWKVILSNRLLNVRDAQSDPNIGPAGRALGKHGTLGLPISLKKGGRASGVLWLWSDEKHQFTDEEVKMLSWVGNEIANAVAWAKLFKERRERMKESINTLIELIGFTDEDGKVLAQNASRVMDWVNEILGETLDDIRANGALSGLLKNGRSERYERALRGLFSALCGGKIDDKLWEGVWDQGLFAIISGTPLPLMTAIMSRLQQGFMRKCYLELERGEAERVFGAFKRASDVVTGLNTEGYVDAFAEGVGIASGLSRPVLRRMAKVGAEQLSAKYRGRKGFDE